QPNKANGCSEGADALRQHAQAKDAGLLGDYVYTASLNAMNQGTTQQNPHGYVEAPATDWRL
ncbi:MAG: terminase, partial [Acinetobacter sp.]